MKVGFIGVGTLGSGLALNVRKAGHDVAVRDARKAAAEPHLAAGCIKLPEDEVREVLKRG